MSHVETAPALAIITARSGSKGLPDKNIRPLLGKPLLAYTVAAALDSGMFADVVVSTDSPHYAQIATEYGASAPFLRSAETSGDSADSWAAVREVLDMLERDGKRYRTVALLQPTSPLRAAEHIKGAFSLYAAKEAEAVVSVCECEHSPLWCNTLDASLSLAGFINPALPKQRQELPQYYRVNGALYLVSTALLAENRENFSLYNEKSYAYVMPIEASVDIDSGLDMLLAEVLLRQQEKNEG
jgi:CMP-N,N'-diacetyllegionaminic acid synthase